MAGTVRVRLCSSAVDVPLSPEGGIGALKSRVAKAFGLTSPFDLVGPEGRLATDQDAQDAIATLSKCGGSLCVNPGDDALLDLEGQLRWVLLRQILADMKSQMAVLDEKLVCERSSREAQETFQSALRNDLVKSKEQLAVEIQQLAGEVREETKMAMDEAVSSMQQVQTLTKEHEANANAMKDSMGKLEELKAIVMEVKDGNLKAQKEDKENKNALQELSGKLEEEVSKRRQCEQSTAGMLNSLQTAVSKQQHAHEALCVEAMRSLSVLESRLETVEKGLKDMAVELQADISALGNNWDQAFNATEETFNAFCAEEEVVREAAQTKLALLEDEMRRAHEAHAEEIWRIQTLVEALGDGRLAKTLPESETYKGERFWKPKRGRPKVPCPSCGKEYATTQALSRHKCESKKGKGVEQSAKKRK